VEMNDAPIYTSRCTLKSFWQEYRIFPDRLELDSLLFGTMKIPFEQIERYEVSPPLLSAAGLRLHLHPRLPEIKLDWADVAEHIMLEKDTGKWRRIDFTPEDPAAFRQALDEAIQQFRANG
jgi:hypothetical protein